MQQCDPRTEDRGDPSARGFRKQRTYCQHILAHNSGPWAPIEMIFGPQESPECDLADGKPPKPLGRRLRVIIRVQRVKKDEIHQKSKKINQNRCPKAPN